MDSEALSVMPQENESACHDQHGELCPFNISPRFGILFILGFGESKEKENVEN
jgi:hypothetical protein